MDEGRAGTGGGLVVPAARVTVTGEAVRVGPPRARADGKPEPTIQVIREGDVVRVIQIVCSCGERICVRCDYT
jgi:hypothetical protein